ncbi:MAG: class I SAM-dependent methyltransferase [Candidatus Rokubacteria bacterium]|nr:class I SAM-dependent methyltransferase [Candidatus Rokubacteria bacterium]
MSSFERQWRGRFERFATRHGEEHQVSGWSAVGLRRRVALFQQLLDGGLFHPGARLLELGCGAGTYVRLLAKRGHPVVGLDYSLPSLERSLASDSGGLGRYVAGEAYALPFASGSFEGLLCIGVLQALTRPEEALREMLRVLGPGGRLLVETLNPWSPLALTRRMRSRLTGEPLRLHYGAPRGIERALGATGARALSRISLLLPPRSLPGLADPLGTPWVAAAVKAVPGMRHLAPHAFWIVGERS